MKALQIFANRIKYTRTEEFINRDGSRHFQKRRRWFAGWVIFWTNLIFVLSGEKARILPTRRWVKQVTKAFKMLYNLKVEGRTSAKIPAMPGMELKTLLTRRKVASELKDQAIVAAVTALKSLHDQGLYHGDTTPDNVLFEIATGQASWVDFEMTYREGTSDVLKAALDLRSFCFCLVKYVREERIQTVLSKVFETYAETDVLESLAEVVEERSVYLGLQLEMSREWHRKAREVVLEGLLNPPQHPQN